MLWEPGTTDASAFLEVECAASPETNSLTFPWRKERAAVLINKLHARYISNSALSPSLSLDVRIPRSFESLFPVTRVMVSYSSSVKGFNTSNEVGSRPVSFYLRRSQQVNGS